MKMWRIESLGVICSLSSLKCVMFRSTVHGVWFFVLFFADRGIRNAFLKKVDILVEVLRVFCR